jgi:uncharacterized membrane protein YoaK (UPF0700 family)
MSQSNKTVTVQGTGCLGAFIGALLSYKLNGSILWALFHFFCGWFYVAYAAIMRWQDVVGIFK